MDKKGKEGKKGGKKGKKGPHDGPTLTEIQLRRCMKLYEAYAGAMEAKCVPEVIKEIKLCLEEETEYKNMLVLPISKDLKAEERFKKAMKEAEEENDRKRIAELRAGYSNTPPQVNNYPFLIKRNQESPLTCNTKDVSGATYESVQ
jgi:hypothetical protein